MPVTHVAVAKVSQSKHNMSLEESVRLARQGCALFDLSERSGLIAVEGPDCVLFLNNLTSNNVARLQEGRGNRNALLTKKSNIISDFDLFYVSKHLLLHLDECLINPTLQHLEAYIFAEEVTCRREPAGIFAIAGQYADEVLGKSADQDLDEITTYGITRIKIAGNDVYAARRTLTGDPGWLIFTNPDATALVKQKLIDSGARQFDLDVLEILRIEAGELVRDKDFDENTLLLELNLGEKIYSLDKGCYPGQEVVSRVVNRGKIPKMLMGLKIEGDQQLKPRLPIEFEDKNVGETKSCTYSPTLESPLAIASLKRDFADDGARFTFIIDGVETPCMVVRLPFYESPVFQVQAEAMYADGMRHYHANEYESAARAFRRAIDIRERYADAWEALAMTIEKIGNIDEAIILNRKFAELDPNAVMARSNLSRLYMIKGFKDKAEEEMGKAQTIEFRLKMREQFGNAAMQKDVLEQRKRAEQEENSRKLETFKQVLEIDPDDEIAHFGLGKFFLENGDMRQAIEHLSIVIKNNEEYSAAYDLLAKAQKAAGMIDDAITTLKNGIAIAEHRGDLMPAKIMKKMQADLESN